MKEDGFTLLELMVAVGFLAVAIAGLLALFINCMLLNELNSNLVVAASDAQYVLEQIKILDFASIATYLPPALTNLENEDINTSYSDISSDLREVTVNVAWSQRQSSRNWTLSTRIFHEYGN